MKIVAALEGRVAMAGFYTHEIRATDRPTRRHPPVV
jgi:hypothetical protein